MHDAKRSETKRGHPSSRSTCPCRTPFGLAGGLRSRLRSIRLTTSSSPRDRERRRHCARTAPIQASRAS